MDEEVANGGEFVRALARGLAVIRCLHGEQLSLSEVARRAGLTRAAARRFLHTLVALGYVDTDGKRFALTPRVRELGLGAGEDVGMVEAGLVSA